MAQHAALDIELASVVGDGQGLGVQVDGLPVLTPAGAADRDPRLPRCRLRWLGASP